MKSASITLRINIQGIKKGKSYVIFAFINLNTAKIKPVHEAKYKIIHTGEIVDEVGLRRAITKWPYLFFQNSHDRIHIVSYRLFCHYQQRSVHL